MLVRALCEQARSILDEDPTARVVAVVVNRVATAREVHRILSSEAGAILLTGRARPWDQNRLLDRSSCPPPHEGEVVKHAAFVLDRPEPTRR